jgi:hypothetical protein
MSDDTSYKINFTTLYGVSGDINDIQNIDRTDGGVVYNASTGGRYVYNTDTGKFEQLFEADI